MNSGCSVCPAAFRMNAGDDGNEFSIFSFASRWFTILPSVKAAGGDTQNTAKHVDTVISLLLLNKLKRFLGVYLVSLAKKAAAFFRISRSSRKTRFSRRSLFSS